MANFEAIQLIGKGPVGGGVLMLSTASDISRTAYLPDDIEVEVRRGVSAVVIRGVNASDYESAIRSIPEQANRALDIFTMTGTARLALADIWSNHVAWWSSSDTATVRVWCSATLPISMQGTVVVHDSNGNPLHQDDEATPSWHESMRYFRMSELTDDLFDAFRNIYLALESLLGKLAPRRDREKEGEWLKRALTSASEIIELEAYLPYPTNESVNEIYAELWQGIRNRVFHAKSASASFLPQDTASRAKVADAKNRYTRLYLDLAQKTFGTQFSHGGLYLSSSTTRHVNAVVTKGWQIGFGADPSSTDVPGDDFSPEQAEITRLPTERSTDPRGNDLSAVIAKMAVPRVPDATVVGRIFTFTSDGERAFAQSIGGHLGVDGFDCCEFMVSVGVTGRQMRKTLYAT